MKDDGRPPGPIADGLIGPRDPPRSGCATPIPLSALNLKEIVLRVYNREKDRDELTWRRACLLASQDHGDHGWLNPSDDERSTLHAVGIGQAPLDLVRKDERLKTIIYPTWYERARAQTLQDEVRHLGRSPFKRTSWEVMCDAFVEAARQTAPGFWRDAAEDLDDAFREYCAWLATGNGTPDEKLHKAFVRLDGFGFRDELLTRLVNECLEEAREMELHELLGGEPVSRRLAEPPTPPAGSGVAVAPGESSPLRGDEGANKVTPIKRPPDDAFAAWRLRDLTGLKTQQAIADEMTTQLGRKVSQGEVSRWLAQVAAYLKAGNILPDLPGIRGIPQSLDPEVIDMGKRQEHRTPRQRERRDPNSD